MDISMVVLVAGIHGVGKTWLCERYALQRNVSHSSASALIKQVLASVSWSADKRVQDIDENQRALELAVNSIVARGKSLLLDGHLVLRDSQGELVDLETAVFERLTLAAIVLITADPHVIAERLVSRDATVRPADLDLFQQREKSGAQRVSQALDIPLIVLHSPDIDTFTQAIDACFNGA